MRIRDLLDRLSRADADVAGDAAEPAWDDRRRRAPPAARRGDRVRSRADLHDPRVLPPRSWSRTRSRRAGCSIRRRSPTRSRSTPRSARCCASGSRASPPDRDLLAAYLETRQDRRRAARRCCSAARARDARVRRRLDPETRARRRAPRSARSSAPTTQRRALLARGRLDGNMRSWMTGWLDAIGERARARRRSRRPRRCVLAMLDELRDAAREARTTSCVELGRSRAATPRDARCATRSATMPLDEAIASELLPHVLDAHRRRQGRARPVRLRRHARARVATRCTARAAPSSPTRLRARTPWAMIDEFQDTDPVQWNIFRTVWMHAEARGPHDRRRSEAGDLRVPRRRRRDLPGRARRDAARRRDAGRARRQPSLDGAARRGGQPRSSSATAGCRCSTRRDHVRRAGQGERRHRVRRPARRRSPCSRCRPRARPTATGPRSRRAIGDEIEALRARAAGVVRARGSAQPFALGQVHGADAQQQGLRRDRGGAARARPAVRARRARAAVPRRARPPSSPPCSPRSPRRATARRGCARCAPGSSTCRGPSSMQRRRRARTTIR